MSCLSISAVPHNEQQNHHGRASLSLALCSWKRWGGFAVPHSQWARVGSQAGKHQSLLIQTGLASNGRRGACSVVLLSWSNLHLVKGEDMGMGLPKNNNGNDSLYFLSLISTSALESRAGSGLRGAQMHLTITWRNGQNWGLWTGFVTYCWNPRQLLNEL